MLTLSTSSQKTIRNLQISLLLLIALNAIGGGIYGLAGAEGVPLEWLKGSPFQSYFLPSLILFICVGGSASYAAISEIRNFKKSYIASYLCAIILTGWICFQVAIIGYVSWLQPTMFVAGIFVLLFTRIR